MWYCPDKNETYQYQWQVRLSFSNVLFPEEINDDHLAFIGVYPLVYVMPEVPAHQIAEPASVIQIDGQWVQQWNIRDRTPEEMPPEPPVDPEQTET